jgi:hypothetical protein
LIDAHHGTPSLPYLHTTSTPGHSSGDVLRENGAQITTLTMEGDTAPTINLPETASHVPGEGDEFDSSASPAPVTSGSASRLAYNAATQILPIVQDAAGAIPIAGSPLKAVIGGVLKVLNAIDECTLSLRLFLSANGAVLIDCGTKQDKSQISHRQTGRVTERRIG